jgi:hypothetical protein
MQQFGSFQLTHFSRQPDAAACEWGLCLVGQIEMEVVQSKSTVRVIAA